MRSLEEINAKIKSGKVVVVTAEEVVDLVKEKGVKETARMVDVVTTGTFGPMCSSGIYFNIKQSTPKIKCGGGRVTVDGVAAYAGWAAADIMLGCTAMTDEDPRNAVYPGLFKFGGAHVIQKLVAGEKVKLQVRTYGTDCYPRKEYEAELGLSDFNNAVLFNPRNAYQLYNVAVNLGQRTIYTYMGVLKPRLGNANFATCGALSPLLNDPKLRTLGIGTRIFLGGGEGYVVWPGTQHVPNPERDAKGLPLTPSATLAVMGDLNGMNDHYLRAASIAGYGASLAVGLGIPLPVIDEEVIAYAAVRDEDITFPVVDYSEAYPLGRPGSLGRVSMAQLMSGEIEVDGKKVSTGGMASRARGREVARELKQRIAQGGFFLTRPVAALPGAELAQGL
ncbi:MAG: homocysteine biosynthesis protein [Proteobacteria bacterium]|nr:homocysteine biosynthesis protein [Pseudomonadota bacterium]MBU1450060.1 homocysteine biosynthesis protein [Pseudomonadota bacterium]MBU2467256.1 homocysteine biosynthesis protein [Pseudomonadota bacterium]MBU2519042.1 homocysteine biosynthesis protein [Pseudomonadota bacterium]